MQTILTEVATPNAAGASRGRATELMDSWRALGARLAAVGDRPLAANERRPTGKQTVAWRLGRLLDPQSAYLPLSTLAGADEAEGVDGAGLATGIGQVAGVSCVIIANDWRHKAGSYQPATLSKHLRAQAIAERERLPCIYLVDSAGIFLPRQAELFAGEQHFGRMFANEARMSAAGIPQIAVVLGMCTAGGAYVPAMADETIMVAGQATIFLAGPALVRAATGEEVSAEALGGADVHGRQSGLVDHLARDEDEALLLCREAVAALGPRTAKRAGGRERPGARAARPPQHSMATLPMVLASNAQPSLPMAEILARLLDDSAWHPFKPSYGQSLLCGTGYLEGQPIGVVANAGLLDGQAAQKGAHFVALCDQRGCPLLFVQDTTGFVVGRAAEARGIAKDGAKMVQAVACASVPKLTLLVGGSYGAGNYAMNGRGLSPNFLFAWPTSRVGVMGSAQAAATMATLAERRTQAAGTTLTDAERDALVRPLRARYEAEASPVYATARLWDDGLLVPEDTRRALSLALACCRQRLAGPGPGPVTRH